MAHDVQHVSQLKQVHSRLLFASITELVQIKRNQSIECTNALFAFLFTYAKVDHCKSLQDMA